MKATDEKDKGVRSQNSGDVSSFPSELDSANFLTGNLNPLVHSEFCILNSSVTPSVSLTLRQGLENYYHANPQFIRNQDIWVGWLRIPWRDLQKHDIMHVVTGYSTNLDQELRLIGFLLTAITWRRPWYFYLQSIGVFLELLWKSLRGKAFGPTYYNPLQVGRFYWEGVRQGTRVRKQIDAYLDPETVMDRELRLLREEYGIENAGTWD